MTWSSRRNAYHSVKVLIACLLTAAGAPASAGTPSEWKGGEGNWEGAAMWDGSLPSRTIEARINGTKEKPSQVTLTHTDVLVSHVSVAEGGGSLASLVLDGPSLTVSGGVDVGKYKKDNAGNDDQTK